MTTLVTGAGGYLGRRIARALPDDELILTVRPGTAAPSSTGRVTVVPVDLGDRDPLCAVDPRRITRVIHAAAITRFDVSRDTAQRVNVDGTAHVRAFAERCPRLDRLVALSTLYAAGRREGPVPEARLDDAGFVNHYEWSKWTAEERLLDPPDLPVTVLRLPTVIADDATGAIGQYNAFHHTLRLYAHGLLTLLPGDPVTPLSLAPASFVVAAVTALLTADTGIYHACADPVPLGTVVATAFAAFARDDAFRRRMLPPPVPCDLDSFRAMAAAVRGLRGPLAAAFASVTPFVEQLYRPKDFRSERLRAAWPAYRAPDPVALISAVSANLIARRTRVAA